MTHAPAPSRPYATVTLSFGLVSLPIALYSATTDAGFKRSQFTPDGHPVGVKPYDKETGADVDRSSIVKKVDTSQGPVVLTDDEIEQLFDLQPNSLRVLAIQPQAYVGSHYIPRSLMYVLPAKQVVGRKKVDSPATQTAFALLCKALKERGAMALCELTSRGKPQPAVLLPNGRLWTVCYTENVREQPPLPDIEIPPAMLSQASLILDSMWEQEPRELADERTALLLAHAESKAREGRHDEAVTTDAAAPVASGVDDLMAALMQTVEQKKKAG